MYIYFLHSGCVNSSLMFLWDLKVPLKIKYFMWLILHGKILTRSNLSPRSWKGLYHVRSVLIIWKLLIICFLLVFICRNFRLILIRIIVLMLGSGYVGIWMFFKGFNAIIDFISYFSNFLDPLELAQSNDLFAIGDDVF
jgi:zinc-binding in reverse transcriptase